MGVRRQNELDLERALYLLRQARDLAKKSGAKRAVDRIRLAITSMGGAIRHARGLAIGQERRER